MIGNQDAAFLILAREDLADRAKIGEFIQSCEYLSMRGGEPRHEVMFDGYNEDPRHIYQIPECVAILKRIMLEVPGFIKVVGTSTFSMILLGTAIKENGVWVVNPAWQSVLPDYKKYTLARKFD